MKNIEAETDTTWNVFYEDVLYFGWPNQPSSDGVENRDIKLKGPIFRANKNILYDENCILSIAAILKRKQVACMRREMLFTFLKYLFLLQRYSSF